MAVLVLKILQFSNTKSGHLSGITGHIDATQQKRAPLWCPLATSDSDIALLGFGAQQKRRQ